MFEMPFNIWCGGCSSMIAKGVMFHAEKKQVGNYFPQRTPEYLVISGAQKKVEEFDTEDAEIMLSLSMKREASYQINSIVLNTKKKI
ncbi:hypothetical protein M8C21_017082 [Ambrosia artemisiifolia]|uniref:Uncharacterized protein n=1 Tax=Ambrosia artemisiifolia TaxID=4212 RepID=A0AAD5DF37_AMBAR|nr:hypothetical protein M8C21_017082 [Ambrosia artemisiifolia]